MMVETVIAPSRRVLADPATFELFAAHVATVRAEIVRWAMRKMKAERERAAHRAQHGFTAEDAHFYETVEEYAEWQRSAERELYELLDTAEGREFTQHEQALSAAGAR
ncbi:hypothetical protein AB3X94_37375 [Paraburkholderia sp. BR10923]|uniref:hypothetical protein n=1 Tax=Paraburkholderia sp. BR10923 TaxID=3236992 RepID=UPI0034D00D01